MTNEACGIRVYDAAILINDTRDSNSNRALIQIQFSSNSSFLHECCEIGEDGFVSLFSSGWNSLSKKFLAGAREQDALRLGSAQVYSDSMHARLEQPAGEAIAGGLVLHARFRLRILQSCDRKKTFQSALR